MPRRLLLIGDGPPGCEPCVHDILTQELGFCCEESAWDSLDVQRLRGSVAELIVAVAGMPAHQAVGRFGWLREHTMDTPTLGILLHEPSEELMQAVTERAEDFLVWPFRGMELRHRVERILGPVRHDLELIRRRLTEETGMAQLFGNEANFVRAIEQIPRIAATDAPVLLLGETGTGKELCARAIHHLSHRRGFPFIPVECGALPEYLAENELFGHVRGAFTDAHSDQKGLAAMAASGTLFLDEVDALSPAAQAKLLRFIQEGTYKALGADRLTRVDVRLLAATNRDLETRVRERQFRPDLYFRLNVLRLQLPPLRERRGDIALLAYHFLQSLCAAGDKARKSFSPSALRIMEQYDWPGNVRELFNVVQRAVVLCAGSAILPSHVSLSGGNEFREARAGGFRQSRTRTVEAFEQAYVLEMVRKHQGNITWAAREAGMDRRGFRRLVQKYGINLLDVRRTGLF